ncbi:MAG: 50S ribosomal protein L10 [Candidatus Pacearchaeota archaeon]
MTEKRTAPIPEEKLQKVSELVDTIKNKKTIILASIKNIPASEYQKIIKKLRDKAIVKFPKKSILFRSLDSSGEESVKKLKEHVKESTAIIFSDMDSFELAAELLENKTPARAKAGQEAPEDISVDKGPTDLVPGPAISELGAVGIPIQIEKGKIHIKKSTVIVKKGEKISSAAADIMNKLDIKPFSIGFTPFAAFDRESGKIYLNIEIDKEKTVEELKYAFGKALPFAVEIGYFVEDTIKIMIGKAGAHGKALENLSGEGKKTEEESSPEENKAEEKSEETENESEEEKKEENKESGEEKKLKEQKEGKDESNAEEKSGEVQESENEKGETQEDNQNKSKEEK